MWGRLHGEDPVHGAASRLTCDDEKPGPSHCYLPASRPDCGAATSRADQGPGRSRAPVDVALAVAPNKGRTAVRNGPVALGAPPMIRLPPMIILVSGAI